MAYEGIFGDGKSSGAFSSIFDEPAAPSKHESGFFGNLVSDIKNTALGIGPGVVGLIRHPIRGVEQIGEATWHTWSPLFSGDFGKFKRQVYEHPLAPILDIATVFTGGVGAVGRVAAAGGRTGRLAKLSSKPITRALVSEVEGAPAIGKTFRPGALSRIAFAATGKESLELGILRAVKQKAAVEAPSWFGRPEPRIVATKKTGPFDVTTEITKERKRALVRDFSKEKEYERAKRRDINRRTAAVYAAMPRQIAAFVAGTKQLHEAPEAVLARIESRAHEQLADHAFVVAPKNLIRTPEGGYRPADGWAFVAEKRHGGMSKAEADLRKMDTMDWAAERIEGLGNRMTTQDWNKALRDPRTGNFRVVPIHEMEAFTKEGAESFRGLKSIFMGGTRFWKAMQLGVVPRYFVNNAVGNTFMLYMSTNPLLATRSLVDGWRQVRGDRAVEKSLRRSYRELYGPHSWVDRYFFGYLRGFSQEAIETIQISERGAIGAKLPDKAVKVVNVLGKGLFPVTHVYADQLLRAGYIVQLVKRHPEVKRLMREEGLDFNQAAERVVAQPLTREAINSEVERVLGNYYDYTPSERALRNIITFYSWDRAIVQHVRGLGPVRKDVLAKIGETGQEELEAALGKLPDYLRGIIPLGGRGGGGFPGMPKEVAGRIPVLNTSGVNPYATLASISEAAGALVGVPGGYETAFEQVNPLLLAVHRAAVEESKKSLLEEVTLGPLDSVPIKRLIDSFGETDMKIDRSGKPRPTVTSKKWQSVFANAMGLPQKYISLEAARDSYQKQKREGIVP